MDVLGTGTTLAHYRILDVLGRGGQATAYKAEDLRLSRHVVLKTLHPDLAATDSARRRFEREACLCSALEHPNISAVYDIGEADGVRYIVMQYVEGSTLERLMGGRPMGPASALSLAIQIADALAVAHAHGIVHRDIKPSNVLVTPAGQAKVLDFGLAKLIDGSDLGERSGRQPSDTQVGVPFGSIGYGSPEQASGAPVDHRTDVFSLGIVLYEMFTGQRPFRGRNPIEVLHAVIHDTPRLVAQLNPKAPPQIQALLDRALAKDPRDRYPTIAALRDELRNVQRWIRRGGESAGALASAGAAAAERARPSWALGQTVGRVFGRLRGGGGPKAALAQEPAQEDEAPVARPAAWATETRRTLAVLPFRNLMQDPDSNFYEFSLADGIIAELAHVRDLVVRPSTYIAHYVGRNVDPLKVGEELAVTSVLAGTFIKSADRLRVTAQLVATGTGEILWSDKIDTAARDLITIQDTIAERLVAGLKLRLSAEEQDRIERQPTRSAEAYDFYLRGRDLLFRYVLKTFDGADLEAAIRMLHEAVGADPDFSQAHATLGRCYVHETQGWGGADYYVLAERSLRRALDLDPGLLEARIQMVHVDLYRGDKDRARASVEQLLREAPNDAEVLFTAGFLYRLDGLYEKALAAYDRLLEINPRDVVIASYSRARVFIHQRDYERASAELERAQGVEPDHPLVKTFLAIARFSQGRIAEARALVEDVLRLNPSFEGAQLVLAWCLNADGEPERARSLVTERVKAAAEADPDIAFWLASFYAMQNRPDEALDWVRRAIRLGNENYPLFAGTTKLDSLRQDPRFGESFKSCGWGGRLAADDQGGGA